jgi:RHS repeat-associated protein
MWAVFQRGVSPSVANFSKPVTNTYRTSQGVYYTIEGYSSECGEGVVPSVKNVQTLDYFPYGATRINTNTSSSDSKRKYIGQLLDDQTNFDYLNARYYDGSRGQFLSAGPVSAALGTPNTEQLAGTNLSTILSSPQSLNSYSYANDNPMTTKESLGKYLEISGSLVLPGRAWSAGIRFDSNGIDYFLSGGVGVGLEAGVEAMWAPGVMLSHTNQISVSANGTVADGFGGRVSTNAWTYDPIAKKRIPNGDPNHELSHLHE